MIPSCPPLHCPSVLSPTSVPNTCPTPPVFHVEHICTPVRLPPPLLSTSRSPVLSHTSLPQLLCADLRHFRLQPNQFHPHTSARPAQSVPGFHIGNGSHIGHIHCDVAHNSPEKRLEQQTKTLLALPSGFHPLRGARLSRPDPSRGRPRVEPVPESSFSLHCP